MKGLIEMITGDRFAQVAKRHSRALGVFERAKEELNAVTLELEQHVIDANTAIAKKMDEITKEKEAISLALSRKDLAVRQIVKIKEILEQ